MSPTATSSGPSIPASISRPITGPVTAVAISQDDDAAPIIQVADSVWSSVPHRLRQLVESDDDAEQQSGEQKPG